MNPDTVMRGVWLGTMMAFALAALPTLLDWSTNPGEVFRNADGTHWHAVGETFWSWLWPLALLTAPATAAVLVIRERRRGSPTGDDDAE